MKFHHFIITRFNVNIYPIDFPLRLEDTWLGLRFELFQKYCFPSLRAQENQDFTWLVLFDEQTPAKYLPLINAFAKYENFVPLHCGKHETIMPQVVEHMQRAAPDAEWLLTTRLDNDDVLATKFVHCVQKVVEMLTEEQVQPSETLYINLPNGLQLSDGDYYDFKDLTNAFVSLVERRANPHTVFWVDHPSIHDVSPVIQVETKPLWVQNVHDTNVYNYLRGDKLEGIDIEKDFPTLSGVD